MASRDRQLLGYSAVAGIVSAGCWATWVATDAGAALALVLVVHAVCALLTAAFVPREKRALAIALGIAVPVLGPLAAAVSISVAGKGGTDLLHDPHAEQARIDGAEIARRLVHSMPVCEALASTDIESRRQALAKLKQRGAAEDIAVLRWARTQRRGDAAVEIALAFEEISARFEHQVSAARAAATRDPTYASLSALFLILADGIASGVVDGQLVARVAAEGARHHAAALALDPDRGSELLVTRVRLELSIHRPDVALELLSTPGLDLTAGTELGELYRDAAYAARRFDLVPEVLDGDA
jgi:hypothetical protein